MLKRVEHIALLQVSGMSLHPNIANSQETLHNDFGDLRAIESLRLHTGKNFRSRPHDAIAPAADSVPSNRSSEEEQVPAAAAKILVENVPPALLDRLDKRTASVLSKEPHRDEIQCCGIIIVSEESLCCQVCFVRRFRCHDTSPIPP